MSLSKNKAKYINSLKEKKFRNEYKTFVAEGEKMTTELLHSLKCQLLIATQEFIDTVDTSYVEEVITVSNTELTKVSFLKTPQQVLAVFYQPENNINIDIDNSLSIALDGIQDPGNMGTIVRLADWYGIENIFCSLDTVDIYNPKTVQATMGAIARVKVHYTDLTKFLDKNRKVPIYGTFLDGENIYDKNLSSHGIIVMGNEGNGIRPETKSIVNEKLYIPSYPSGEETSESLNVAIATAIVCAEFRRRISNH